MLHLKITQLALGSDFTVVVTGDGDAENRQGDSVSSAASSQDQSAESWASTPHVVTAADLHLGGGSKDVDSRGLPSASSADASPHVDEPLANGSEAGTPQQLVVSQTMRQTASELPASAPSAAVPTQSEPV